MQYSSSGLLSTTERFVGVLTIATEQTVLLYDKYTFIYNALPMLLLRAHKLCPRAMYIDKIETFTISRGLSIRWLRKAWLKIYKIVQRWELQYVPHLLLPIYSPFFVPS